MRKALLLFTYYRLVKIFNLSFFFLLYVYTIPAQLLDNSSCKVFSDEPFFSQEFIKNNGIKKITGEISTKKNLQVIEQRNLITNYEFDKQGRLIKQYRSFDGNSNRKDTTFIHYYYTPKNQIKTQRTSDSYGFFSDNFEYDDKGNIITKTYCRDENIGKNKKEFKLGKQHVIVKETYAHESTDSTHSKITFNNYGKKYLVVTKHYNKDGYLTKEVKKLTINKKKSIIKYEYDDKGNISKRTVYPNFNKPENTATVYQYDELGNLEYIDEYTNGKKITHKEIIYNKSTLLMKAMIIQDIETNYIKIIKYSYEYW